MNMINRKLTDRDDFELMIYHKRSVAKVSLFVGIPLFLAMAIKNFIRGDNIMAFSNCMELLILILLGFVIMRRIEEKSEYRIYSILFRLFFGVMGVSLFYDIGFQSNFSRIEWCYIYPVLVFLAVGVKEGAIWVSIFYGILAFLILNLDLQGITLFQIQELRTRFLVSFFAVCMLSFFLVQGFRRVQQRLLHHQRILKESENRYRQAYEQLNMEMQERKQAEEALRRNEEKYRTILEDIEEGYFEVDLAGNLTFINDAGCRHLGYTREELIGMNNRQYVDEKNAKKVFEAFNQIYRTGEPGRVFDYELIRKDGTKRQVEVSASLRKDSSAKPIGFRGVTRDITERKQAEEALRQSEERYRTILENMQEVYYEIDLAGNFIFLNEAFYEHLGYTKEEMIGKKSLQYQDETTARELQQAYNRLYRTGEPIRAVEAQWISKDGAKRTREMSASLIRDSEGKPIGFRGISRDITERKRAEEALKRNQEELIQKNKEIGESRTNLQLALEELERAYKELKTSQAKILQQEKMASLGQLAAGVAHEINNPMAFISSNLGTLDKYVHRLTGFIQTQSEVIESLKATDAIEGLKRKQKELKLDYITEDINQLITESLDGSERVRKIVQGLKNFARVDEAEYKYADINECIESTLNIVWNELKYKATLKKDYGNLPLTKCYPQQMNQVFMNLLINAGHAIEKQGEITIKTWDGDGSIWVAISDTGHGIPGEDLNKIFEPFFTTKEVGKGTGLGLSITYEIVQKHNGEITVESEVGRGTTFTVRLPII